MPESTGSPPSTAKTPREAIAADLTLALKAAAAAGIPVIVGSAGTSGTDAGVDWVAAVVDEDATRGNRRGSDAGVEGGGRRGHSGDRRVRGNQRHRCRSRLGRRRRR